MARRSRKWNLVNYNRRLLIFPVSLSLQSLLIDAARLPAGEMVHHLQ